MSAYTPDAIKEVEYWLRLAIFLHQPLKNALLHVLHNKSKRTDYVGLPEDQLELYKKLKSNKQKINQLLREGVLKKDQVKTLLPSSKKTDSENFDVTLIYVVIRNFTTLPQPTNGWGKNPGPTDNSTSAFVMRAKKWRNDLIHNTKPKDITEVKFNNMWADGEKIVKKLGFITCDTNKLKRIDLDPRTSIVACAILKHMNNIHKELAEQNKKILDLKDQCTLDRREIEVQKTKLKEIEIVQAELKEMIARSEEIAATNISKGTVI